MHISLCVGGSKGKAGIQLKFILEKLCTYLVDKPLIRKCYYSNPQCTVIVKYLSCFTYKVLAT